MTKPLGREDNLLDTALDLEVPPADAGGLVPVDLGVEDVAGLREPDERDTLELSPTTAPVGAPETREVERVI